VGGADPRALDPEARRRLVGVVPQVVQLFSGTVRENVAFGDESLSDADVRRALSLAGAEAMVDALPGGLDARLGAGGGAAVRLSAGQRQLLALARALVADPRVLLLDEATAAVDAASDAAFRAALRTGVLARGRGVLTVAHRLSTALEADRVVVLERGQVVEEGPPDELIRQGGRFAALVELETAGWDWRESTGGEA
jgi:ATP-binding cassette subfamily B protein